MFFLVNLFENFKVLEISVCSVTCKILGGEGFN